MTLTNHYNNAYVSTIDENYSHLNKFLPKFLYLNQTMSGRWTRTQTTTAASFRSTTPDKIKSKKYKYNYV